jgi:hypothetical protein
VPAAGLNGGTPGGGPRGGCWGRMGGGWSSCRR